LSFWACKSALSTSTVLTLVGGIYNQEILSTEEWQLPSGWVNAAEIAYPIQIRFKSQELTSSGTETWIKSTAALSESGSTTPQSSSTAQPSSQSGLSTGAKIGLGVGLGVGIPLLILSIVFGIIFYRKRTRATHLSRNQYSSSYGSEMPMQSPFVTKGRRPEYQQGRQELEAREMWQR